MNKPDQLLIPDSVRLIICDRDGESCRICGSVRNLEIHHIYPRSESRLHDFCNLILLCMICHDAVEDHRLPAWDVHDIEKLYHLSPCKGFSHRFDYKRLKCVIHDLALETRERQPTPDAFVYNNSKPVI